MVVCDVDKVFDLGGLVAIVRQLTIRSDRGALHSAVGKTRSCACMQ